METIVHDPLNRITAKEANLRATRQKENFYKKSLANVYGAIHADVSLGLFETEYIINGFEEADYIFDQLVMNDEYSVDLVAVNSDPDDERMKLTISWDSESLIDPDKKYILPMEGTEAEDCLGNMAYSYAAKQEGGSWYIGHKSPFADPKIHFTVTAKDIKDAPEWVKAIEPVEVEG